MGGEKHIVRGITLYHLSLSFSGKTAEDVLPKGHQKPGVSTREIFEFIS